SLMANWLLVAMLLRISDAARRPVTGSASAQAAAPTGGPAQLHGAPTEVIRP
ncbi:MAG TPA: FtsW/RodA/SpoVE family cell cycle protein, partial [Micromonosporaceae bacterium]|nr:FtsW/RodA/SpoVE family cell cycle protein [Micromonosporaceae bacterium]